MSLSVCQRAKAKEKGKYERKSIELVFIGSTGIRDDEVRRLGRPGNRRDDPRRHTLAGGHHQSSSIARSMDLESPLPRGYPPPSSAMLYDDDPGIMSEAETSSTGFRRGGKQRSSLPVVRTPSKTLERPLGEKLLSRPPSHKPVMSMVNNWSFVGPGKCSGRVPLVRSSQHLLVVLKVFELMPSMQIASTRTQKEAQGDSRKVIHQSYCLREMGRKEVMLESG
ncbi:hypothetical protein RUM43_014362 [Polyplax serrata]|uniref:Uncharacterized protein n=1 Tax=Polyplax serrata TaxID=468196 RepID=A0AAN8RYS4_POLSC